MSETVGDLMGAETEKTTDDVEQRTLELEEGDLVKVTFNMYDHDYKYKQWLKEHNANKKMNAEALGEPFQEQLPQWGQSGMELKGIITHHLPLGEDEYVNVIDDKGYLPKGAYVTIKFPSIKDYFETKNGYPIAKGGGNKLRHGNPAIWQNAPSVFPEKDWGKNKTWDELTEAQKASPAFADLKQREAERKKRWKELAREWKSNMNDYDHKAWFLNILLRHILAYEINGTQVEYPKHLPFWTVTLKVKKNEYKDKIYNQFVAFEYNKDTKKYIYYSMGLEEVPNMEELIKKINSRKKELTDDDYALLDDDNYADFSFEDNDSDTAEDFDDEPPF